MPTYKKQLPFSYVPVREDFASLGAGSVLTFAASTAGAFNTAAQQQLFAYLQTAGDSTNIGRLGVTRNTLAGTTSASRATMELGLQQSIRFNPAGNGYSFYYETDISFSTSGGTLINYANDPTLSLIGFADSFSLNPQPSFAVYVRPPRLGETSFLKYVVRLSGTESIFQTTIPYSVANFDQFYRIKFSYDSFVDRLTITISNAIKTEKYSINTISSTYPILASTFMRFGFGCMRAAGIPPVPVQSIINVDSVTQFVRPINFPFSLNYPL